ncbi:MAG: PilN domain-containing protein [Candidatus Aminicenantales bacterium]
MIRINLFKPERKDIPLPSLAAEGPSREPAEETPRKSSTPSLVLLLTVVAIAAATLTLSRSMGREQRLLRLAEEDKRRLTNVLTKLEQLELQKSIVEKKISLINLLKSQREIAVRIMDELSKNLPDWVWLNEVSYENQLLRIKGRAMSNTQIAEYISKLENTEALSQVNVIEITQRTQRNEQFLEFILSAAYGSGPPPPPPPAATGKRPAPVKQRTT